MFLWRRNDGKQASVCFTDLVALLYWRNGRAKMGKLTRGWAGCPEPQPCALTLDFPIWISQASGGSKGSVPQTRKHSLQWPGGGIAVVVLPPWPELHLSWPLLRKAVGVRAEQKGRGCPRLGEEVVSKDVWEGEGGEGVVQGWAGHKRGVWESSQDAEESVEKKEIVLTLLQ